jgi:hypothetical protein
MVQISLKEGKVISSEELQSLNEERGISAPQLKNIRQTHRLLARCLALGMADGDAAAAVGLTPGRVSILKNDPTFRALMQTFQATKDAHAIDIMEKVHEVGMIAVEEIRDRLLDNSDDITMGQLLEITTSALDRLGHGPTAKVNITTVNINALKEAAQNARRDQIVFRDSNVLEAVVVHEDEVDKNSTKWSDL